MYVEEFRVYGCVGVMWNCLKCSRIVLYLIVWGDLRILSVDCYGCCGRVWRTLECSRLGGV